MKINMLPGIATTPEVFVEMLKENAHLIENIACVIQWKDGGANTCNTAMKNERKAWLKAVFNDEFKVFE